MFMAFITLATGVNFTNIFAIKQRSFCADNFLMVLMATAFENMRLNRMLSVNGVT
jgi:hypothetical protein